MKEAIDQLVALAQGLGKPFNIEQIKAPLALVPQGLDLQVLEQHLPAPTRTKQNLTVLDAATFIDYVKRFTTNATVVFCNGPNGRTFRAVFDYHQPDQPAWGSHSASYACPLTVEWGNWKATDRKRLSQADFAEFIEDNVKDVVTNEQTPGAPSAADMLEISRTLQAQKNITFRQRTRLDTRPVHPTHNQ